MNESSIFSEEEKASMNESSIFSEEEISHTRRQNLQKGLSRAIKKAVPPVKSGIKSIWDLANYFGRGYLPFDVIQDIKNLNSEFKKEETPIDGFKRLLKENIEVPAERINNSLLLGLLSEDQNIRSSVFDEIKKSLDIDDRKLDNILEEWLHEREKNGLTI